eukprot:TRINITY_DN4704_c0_g2_i1.p1 TRINITY_DN4704_c0_g2~~TRINITY_DN4704_c0_g2_i1.p1  ORF type:complete len:390 (+),score=140.02 TRINITY_DN4704_c0_g2_i1:58-1170(+)
MAPLLLYWASAGTELRAVEVSSEGTVADLKAAIEAAGGPARWRQLLRVGGAELDADAVALSDTGVSFQAQVQVTARHVPASVVTAGSAHSAAILDGRVHVWGDNSFDQASVPDFGGETPWTLATGAHATQVVAVTRDGAVVQWASHRPLADLGGRKALSAVIGAAHAAAIVDDGSVLAWGDNTFGQTEVPDLAGRAAQQMSAGVRTVLLLTADGQVLQWGRPLVGEAHVPDFGGARIVGVAAGSSHNVVVTEEGGVVCWGLDDFGQCSPPDFEGRKVVAATIGARTTVALLEDNTTVAWGGDYTDRWSARPPEAVAGRIRSVVAGGRHYLATLTSGEVACWGNNSSYGSHTKQALLPRRLRGSVVRDVSI